MEKNTGKSQRMLSVLKSGNHVNETFAAKMVNFVCWSKHIS